MRFRQTQAKMNKKWTHICHFYITLPNFVWLYCTPHHFYASLFLSRYVSTAKQRIIVSSSSFFRHSNHPNFWNGQFWIILSFFPPLLLLLLKMICVRVGASAGVCMLCFQGKIVPRVEKIDERLRKVKVIFLSLAEHFSWLSYFRLFIKSAECRAKQKTWKYTLSQCS